MNEAIFKFKTLMEDETATQEEKDSAMLSINTELKAMGAGYYFDPEKQVIKDGEENEYGMLNSGTGHLNKVKVIDLVDGKVDLGYELGDAKATVFFGGEWLEVVQRV